MTTKTNGSNVAESLRRVSKTWAPPEDVDDDDLPSEAEAAAAIERDQLIGAIGWMLDIALRNGTCEVSIRFEPRK